MPRRQKGVGMGRGNRGNGGTGKQVLTTAVIGTNTNSTPSLTVSIGLFAHCCAVAFFECFISQIFIAQVCEDFRYLCGK